ncbi:MAG: hypothetical protein M0P19_15555, partial [Nevskia sp.]|nr:hypothetical protein [Nevskia sp.]
MLAPLESLRRWPLRADAVRRGGGDSDAGWAGVGGRCYERPTRAGLGIDLPFTSKPHAQGSNIAFDAFAVAVIVFNQFVNQLDLSRADSSHRPISLTMRQARNSGLDRHSSAPPSLSILSITADNTFLFVWKTSAGSWNCAVFSSLRNGGRCEPARWQLQTSKMYCEHMLHNVSTAERAR